MQAVKGLFADGLFTPINKITLPRRAHAILIIEEIPAIPEENIIDPWYEIDKMAEASVHEPMPDFPRFTMGREPIVFTED